MLLKQFVCMVSLNFIYIIYNRYLKYKYLNCMMFQSQLMVFYVSCFFVFSCTLPYCLRRRRYSRHVNGSVVGLRGRQHIGRRHTHTHTYGRTILLFIFILYYIICRLVSDAVSVNIGRRKCSVQILIV